MTSDAKIGLLLGLVFIFLIAFLVNGLPNLRANENNNELTISAVNSTSNNLGIADNERKASKHFIQQKIRFKTKLPKNNAATKPIIVNRYALITKPAGKTSKKSANLTLRESLRKTAERTAATPKTNPTRKRLSRKALPKTYIVASGDTLAVIAQKFYGAQAGNKNLNITKIYKANSAILESPDDIYVGQTLIIPPLASSHARYSTRTSSASTVYKRLKAMGKGIMAANTNKKASGTYIVKPGDSLWTIADDQLGDGDRYSDIFQMNTNIMQDEDTLVVGMRLKLPE
ncbi:MAG: LysM peptidoglycan-binding domain-containing protein [Planctomycetes bacterium]|nr:LysM peptidoglycan-binding domain-containing protein [Planctomycetota bacterium]